MSSSIKHVQRKFQEDTLLKNYYNFFDVRKKDSIPNFCLFLYVHEYVYE